MQLFNTVFINTDVGCTCGHVLPATIEIQGSDPEIQISDARRITLRVFFVQQHMIRFFAEGGRIHRITDCPKCHNALPASIDR